ncbi:MAG: sulfatase/phosphatase domain-containing protein, partial [Nitrospirota bacterium]
GAEGNDKHAMIAGTPGTRDFLFYAQKWSWDNHNDWGRPGVQSAYGPAWAQVSMTPFKNYKAFTSEGGHREPLIVSGAGVKLKPGTINRSLLHVMDIAPTILELAGVKHPETYQGKPVAPIQGKSWVPMLEGKTEGPRTDKDWLGWEVFGNRAIRQGNWKLVWEHKPFGTDEWELYNLTDDLGEKHDLSAQYPDKKRQLLSLWDEYVKTNSVIIPDRDPFEGMEEKLPPRVPVTEGWPPLIYKKQFVPPKELLKE